MKAERKPLTKKTRFDVFKRDQFRCAYCGSCPPVVILEIDHITPVSKGGTNSAENLITACFDCNRGKGAAELSVVPDSLQKRAELIAEKHEQMKAMDRLLKATKKREEKKIDEIEEIFCKEFKKLFSERFRASVRGFLQSLPFSDVEMAIWKSCSRKKGGDPEGALKYFCGICWNMIKEKK